MFFDWWTPMRNLPYLLTGALYTMGLTLAIFVLSFAAGTGLGVIRYNRKNPIVYAIASVYVELIRNTPALVQIFLIYFGLPQFGISLPPIVAGIIALTINNSAYISEIVRAGIQVVHKGQTEASHSIGLTESQTFLFVIFPQALRNIFPSMTNQFVMIIFGTTLLSTLDVRELTQRASILNSETFRTMEIFVFVTLMYYGISILCAAALRWINRKYFPQINSLQ
jgi:polar amino acid transport system permease protein